MPSGKEMDKRPLCGAESCSARDVANTTSSPLRNDAVWKKQYVVPSRRRLLPAALPCILQASKRAHDVDVLPHLLPPAG